MGPQSACLGFYKSLLCCPPPRVCTKCPSQSCFLPDVSSTIGMFSCCLFGPDHVKMLRNTSNIKSKQQLTIAGKPRTVPFHTCLVGYCALLHGKSPQQVWKGTVWGFPVIVSCCLDFIFEVFLNILTCRGGKYQLKWAWLGLTHWRWQGGPCFCHVSRTCQTLSTRKLRYKHPSRYH